MTPLRRAIPFLFLLVFPYVQASPSEMQNIQKSYQSAMDRWAQEMRIATTDAERTKVWGTRPDTLSYAKQMWTHLSISLNQEWALDPLVWFMLNTSNLLTTDANGSSIPAFAKENEMIRNAIESHHLKSSKLIPVCAALAASPNPRSLAVLEKILESHPNPKTQGVAALGAAIQLKSLGDDGEIMRKRLTYLRKAIIQSSDIEIQGVSVAKLAEDELHIIRYLTKGRIAPNLVGVDSGGRPLSLSSSKGKVVMLLFWNSNMQNAQRVLDITKNLANKFKDRKLDIIGINNDPVSTLRSLQSNGGVTWTNFSDPENTLGKEYLINAWPVVFILDGEGKIHFVGAPGSFAELTADALLAESGSSTKE